jgi:hypothetical protein
MTKFGHLLGRTKKAAMAAIKPARAKAKKRAARKPERREPTFEAQHSAATQRNLELLRSREALGYPDLAQRLLDLSDRQRTDALENARAVKQAFANARKVNPTAFDADAPRQYVMARTPSADVKKMILEKLYASQSPEIINVLPTARGAPDAKASWAASIVKANAAR